MDFVEIISGLEMAVESLNERIEKKEGKGDGFRLHGEVEVEINKYEDEVRLEYKARISYFSGTSDEDEYSAIAIEEKDWDILREYIENLRSKVESLYSIKTEGPDISVLREGQKDRLSKDLGQIRNKFGDPVTEIYEGT